MCFVFVVSEAGGELAGIVRIADLLTPRQDRYIPVNRASCPADVSQAEAANRLIAIVIPPVWPSVGAPLNHAERQSRSRKRVAVRTGSDESIHGIVRRILFLRLSRKTEHNEQTKKGKRTHVRNLIAA